MMKQPLFEILALEGKRCNNSIYEWHKMPKSRYKPDVFFHGEQPPNNNTFVITTAKKPFKVVILCYHCAITLIGNIVKDWKNAGATDEEISGWLPDISEKPLIRTTKENQS